MIAEYDSQGSGVIQFDDFLDMMTIKMVSFAFKRGDSNILYLIQIRPIEIQLRK